MPEFTCQDRISLFAKLVAGSMFVAAEPRDTAVVDVQPYDNSSASREAAEQTLLPLRRLADDQVRGPRRNPVIPRPVRRALRVGRGSSASAPRRQRVVRVQQNRGSRAVDSAGVAGGDIEAGL